MADATEMVRIMRHSANRLSEEDPLLLLPHRMSIEEEARCLPAALSLSIAIGYAQAVLRMVAACMETEGEDTEATDG